MSEQTADCVRRLVLKIASRRGSQNRKQAAARSSQQAGSGLKKPKTSENAIYAVNYVPGGGVNEII